MPVLGLGVWQMAAGGETEQAVEWALEAGYRHIDTASMYRNEQSVGAALKRSDLPREQVFVTTKLMPTHMSAARELEKSLARFSDKLGFHPDFQLRDMVSDADQLTEVSRINFFWKVLRLRNGVAHRRAQAAGGKEIALP